MSKQMLFMNYLDRTVILFPPPYNICGTDLPILIINFDNLANETFR